MSVWITYQMPASSSRIVRPRGIDGDTAEGNAPAALRNETARNIRSLPYVRQRQRFVHILKKYEKAHHSLLCSEQTIFDSSLTSAEYSPYNLLINKPADVSSRWSAGSTAQGHPEGKDMGQTRDGAFILLKLKQWAVLCESSWRYRYDMLREASWSLLTISSS